MLTTLLGNWELKLLSLLIAVALWFFVTGTEKTEVTLAAALEYSGLGDDLVLVGPRRDHVNVEVQALRWLASRLTADALRVRVNLGDVRDGESVIQLLPEQVPVPHGVIVTRITPARLRFTAASAARHTVRVTPQISGTPAPGFAVERVKANPSSVEIKGPRTTIERRDQVVTAPVDVSGSRETVTRTVALALPDSVYATNERTVQVTVEIRSEAGMRQRGRDSKQ